MDYDLIVIGGGAAGLGAVRAATRSGARNLLISDGEPGGDDTFTGCVPSKTLIEAARQHLPYPAATQRVRDTIAQIAATEDAATLRREGIDVILGRARFTAPNRIQIDNRQLDANRFVIATGTAPAIPPIPGLDTIDYLTNDTIFDEPQLPASLAVLGGGAVGCELAQAFSRLGSDVTIVEATDRLLPLEDPDASAVINTVFAREHITAHTSARVERVTPEGSGGVRLHLADGADITADRLLVAVGRHPVTEGLNLDAAGIRVDERGYIITDDSLATTAPAVHAAGDITGRLLFTHAAYAMARLAAGNALARRPWQRHRYNPTATPWVTVTDPEVAQVGILETDPAARGGRVAYLPMSDMDRAVTADATDGFIKLLAGPRRLLGNLGGGHIRGASIVARRAGELIHEPALAMATHMFAGRLAAATHAYPTWSYGIQLTAAQFFMPVGGRTARPAAGPAPYAAGQR